MGRTAGRAALQDFKGGDIFGFCCELGNFTDMNLSTADVKAVLAISLVDRSEMAE